MSSIQPLTEWREPLHEMRTWVSRSIADGADDFATNWETKMQVVGALAAELGPDETWKWQALGVVLGDAISLVSGVEWAEVTDEYGTDPCLVIDPSSGYTMFPMTMLSKRVERGERVDWPTICDLFGQAVEACGAVDE